ARSPRPIMGTTENLSGGGLRIVTGELLAARDLVHVRLDLPGNLPGFRMASIEAEARVRRISPVPGTPPRYGVALQLVIARESEQQQWVDLAQALEHWVRAHAAAGG